MWYPNNAFIISCGHCGANELVDVKDQVMPNEVEELAKLTSRLKKDAEIGKN